MTDTKADKKAFWALVRVIFKGEDRSGGSLMPTDKKGKPRSKVTRIILYLVLLLSFGMLAAALGWQGYAMGKMGMPLFLIYRTGLMVQIIIGLLFGIFGVVSFMYFPKDLPLYLSLPYTGKQVMAAKYLHYFSLNFLGTLLFLPLLVAGMIGSGAAWYHYVTGITAYLLGSIAIDVLLTIFAILLMRFSAFARDKDRFTTLFSTLTIVIVIVFTVWMQFATGNAQDGGTLGIEKLAGIGGPWDIALGILSPPILLGHWLFSDSVLKMLGGVVLSLLAVGVYTVIMLKLGERYYFQGVMAMQQAGGKRSHKKFGGTELAKVLKPMPSMSHRFAQQQLLKLRRDPTFFTQMLLQPLLMPLMILGILAAVMIIGLRREGGFSLVAMLDLIHEFTAGLTFNSQTMLFIVMGVAGWVIMTTLSDALFFRMAVSTDGQDFFYFRQLPATLTSYMVGLQRAYLPLSLVPNLIIIGVLLAVVRMPLVNSLYLLGNSLILSYSCAMIYMVYGALSPKLDWDNEVQLIKGDPKLVLLVYSGFLVGILVAGPQAILMWGNYVEAWLDNGLMLILTLVFNLLVAVGLTLAYYGPGKKKLATIES